MTAISGDTEVAGTLSIAAPGALYAVGWESRTKKNPNSASAACGGRPHFCCTIETSNRKPEEGNQFHQPPRQIHLSRREICPKKRSHPLPHRRHLEVRLDSHAAFVHLRNGCLRLRITALRRVEPHSQGRLEIGAIVATYSPPRTQHSDAVMRAGRRRLRYVILASRRSCPGSRQSTISRSERRTVPALSGGGDVWGFAISGRAHASNAMRLQDPATFMTRLPNLHVASALRLLER